MGAGDADGHDAFPNTRWTEILRAKGNKTKERQESLQSLAQAYWKPIYGYCRRKWSKSIQDAEDLTQAFFLMLIQGDALKKYDPGLGRFRPYLKTLLQNFEGDRYDYLMALKRGGDRKFVSISADDTRRLEECLADPRTPDAERMLDVAWKREVLGRAVERARHAFLSTGRQLKFQVFEARDLVSEGEPPSYEKLAARFGVKESDVRNYLFEVREQVRKEIRADLTNTVADREQLDDEFRELFGGGPAPEPDKRPPGDSE